MKRNSFKLNMIGHIGTYINGFWKTFSRCLDTVRSQKLISKSWHRIRCVGCINDGSHEFDPFERTIEIEWLTSDASWHIEHHRLIPLVISFLLYNLSFSFVSLHQSLSPPNPSILPILIAFTPLIWGKYHWICRLVNLPVYLPAATL